MPPTSTVVCPIFAAVIGIVDEDFRDPAHIYRRRETYTDALIAEVLRAADVR